MTAKDKKVREPFPLPIITVDSKTSVEVWQQRIWRANDEKLTILLGAFWQEAYSQGLKDMDRMHERLDQLSQTI